MLQFQSSRDEGMYVEVAKGHGHANCMDIVFDAMIDVYCNRDTLFFLRIN
jgi:hypothetical protein